MKKRLGVIVGRFQTSRPTVGHKFLFTESWELSDEILIVVGDAPLSFTDKNPLPYFVRYGMLKEHFPEAMITRLMDVPESNDIWSDNLDDILDTFADKYDITLFGSRDSFIDSYTGKHTCHVIETVHPNVSATSLRRHLGDLQNCDNTTAFREGIIHTVENKFPTAYGTVDVAVVSGDKVLLVKKPGQDQYQFPGGFIDPTDECNEDAAMRELYEECGRDMKVGSPFYIGSAKIRDPRYEGTKDGIMTNFFKVNYKEGEVRLDDDLEGGDFDWFPIKVLNERIMRENHMPLALMLKNFFAV